MSAEEISTVINDFTSALKFLVKSFIVPFEKLKQPPFSEGYNLGTAAKVKQGISLPVITVGGMRSRNFMEEAIETGKTDFVSMARLLIAEPDLANKFKNGISEVATCANCNICVVATDTKTIRCYRKRRTRQINIPLGGGSDAEQRAN